MSPISTPSPRCSPLVLARTTATSTTTSPSFSGNWQSSVGLREAPSPLLLATSPSSISSSPSYLSLSAAVSLAPATGQCQASTSPEHSPLLAASSSTTTPYPRQSMKSRKPILNVSMPSPPRLANPGLPRHRFYAAAAVAAAAGNTGNTSLSSGLTPALETDSPYLGPVGSPSGPVTPMQLADEEFPFPNSAVSPTNINSVQGSSYNVSWLQQQRMNTIYNSRPSSPYSRSSRIGAGEFYTATSFLTSNGNLPANAGDANTRWTSTPVSPISPLSPTISENGIVDVEELDDLRMDGLN
ncbi:uncharacterized protein V1516DRAFT_319299 [Lipomyces oligophaga]|uniref:uncharacterized protein n=1 Tax=Lipomyces oligophaga TaxID=45792 RepID=UPI0034CF4F13